MFDNVIVTPCRWEVNSIAEFCLYYKAIGFDHIYIYCNDDTPWDTYTSLIPMVEIDKPFVTFIYYDFPGQQRQMLLHWLTHYRHETRHVAFFDADEFLCLPGKNNIIQFLEDLDFPWDVLYFNWSCFGPEDYKRRPEGSVLLHYTHREAALHTLTKVIVKTAIFSEKWLQSNPKDVIWHGISAFYRQHLCRNVLGEDMATYYDGQNAQNYLSRASISEEIRNTAVINHYAMKSEEDCLRRAERGMKGDFVGQNIWKDVWEAGKFSDLAARMNAVEDTRLRDFWLVRLGSGAICSVSPQPTGKNLALNKPATQSSLSVWSIGATVEEDAAGAVNGIITGRQQFHTGHEASAWWQVDLQAVETIRVIRLFNRLDAPQARGRGIAIVVSLDGLRWEPLTETPRDRDFGGADGQPFVWRGECAARYVRLSVENEFLHLDQVEIYDNV